MHENTDLGSQAVLGEADTNRVVYAPSSQPVAPPEATTTHVMSPERDDYITLTVWYRKLGNHLRFENRPQSAVGKTGVEAWIATGNPTAVNILDRARILLSVSNTMTPEEKTAALTALEREADQLVATTPPIENSYLSTRSQ